MEARNPHRSLFAVWHWPRWVWGVVVVLMLAAYVLSPPLAVVLPRSVILQPIVIEAYAAIYGPVFWCARNLEPVKVIWDTERHILTRMIGYRGIVVDPNRPKDLNGYHSRK